MISVFLSFFKSTFCYWDSKCTLRLIIQLSNALDVILANLLCKPPHIICWQPPSKTSWTTRFVNNHKVHLVHACQVCSKSKIKTVLLNFAPTNFSLHSCLVWLGTIKWASLVHIVNIFQRHNQCEGGRCLPNCVQVVLCRDVVINTEVVENITKMKCIHHSILLSPPKPRNWRVAWAYLGV